MIARLKEILSKPDPALGYINGRLRFWLGWAQQVSGNRADAEVTWRQARSELESFLKEQPENYSLLEILALTNAGLGDKAAAMALSERAMAMLYIGKDALIGAVPIQILARVAAKTGEPDRAIAALQELLSTTVRGPAARERAAHSCVASARSHVRPASLRSAFPKTLRGKAAVNSCDFFGESRLSRHAVAAT